MARRSFLFCDICNPQGLRTVELRRSTGHDVRDGRRLSDGRTWFEGSEKEAKRAGWVVADHGQHICPSCFERLREMRDVLEERLFAGVSVTEILRDEID